MKKIMFNDRYGLTQAVIEGRKTMTRRLVPWSLTEQWIEFVSDAPSVGGVYVHESEKDFYERETPRYKVGEIVAVAQNYFSTYDESKWENGIWYNEFADGSDITNHAGWINKMFVKAEYMPHQIRITGIRCERLQDISDEDCFREGISESWYESTDTTTYGFTDEKKGTAVEFDTPRKAFAALIDKVSGRGTWASNPWVVVYEFELVK